MTTIPALFPTELAVLLRMRAAIVTNNGYISIEEIENITIQLGVSLDANYLRLRYSDRARTELYPVNQSGHASLVNGPTTIGYNDLRFEAMRKKSEEMLDRESAMVEGKKLRLDRVKMLFDMFCDNGEDPR